MNEARNPYAPPIAEVADARPDDAGDALIPSGRRVPAGNGVRWFTAAARMFFQQPWKWIGVILLLGVLSFVAGLIPLSGIVTTVLWPVVSGGLVLALNIQRQSGAFEIRDVFAGFGPRFGSLAIVGCVMVLLFPIAILSFFFFVGGDMAATIAVGGSDVDSSRIMSMNFLLAILVYLLFAIPIGAAAYFAPALIMLHGVRPGEAMKMSFIGCIKNILAGLVFGVVMLVVMAISMIPLLLGLLVTVPIAMISVYTAYRDIFVAE